MYQLCGQTANEEMENEIPPRRKQSEYSNENSSYALYAESESSLWQVFTPEMYIELSDRHRRHLQNKRERERLGLEDSSPLFRTEKLPDSDPELADGEPLPDLLPPCQNELLGLPLKEIDFFINYPVSIAPSFHLIDSCIAAENIR